MTTHYINKEKKEVTFFLVDDDDIDRRSIIRSFNTVKIANPIVEAIDGEDALKKLKTEDFIKKPYIILLDLNMPNMNGIDFLKEVRQDSDFHDSIVFILTTSDDDKDKTEAYDLNVAGYIVKDDAGKNFIDVVTMLDNYWRVVELPA